MPSYAEVASKNGTFETSSDSQIKNELHVGYDLLGRAIDEYPQGKPYSSAIEDAPVTFERIPYIPREGDVLPDAGTARATIAASKESPNGTVEDGWARQHQHQTVVEQHVAYWDKDGDGVIWPLDTYRGCRAFGWNVLLSAFAAFVIHVNLSYPTGRSWLPDPFFRLWTDRLYKDKHGSDSMSFDNEGRFRPQNFEDFFAKYDRGNKGGLDVWDLLRAWKGQRMAFDFFGWSASFLEWLATYLLIWPEDGILRKEEVRRVFDGSIFPYKAKQHEEKKRRDRQRRKEQAEKSMSWLKAKVF